MYISDGWEAESLEEMAKIVATFHVNNNKPGSPDIKYIFYSNDRYETELPKDTVRGVIESAEEWVEHLRESADDDAAYRRECLSLIYDRI